MNFILGVASSIVASIILIAASKISISTVRRLPRGVRFIQPSRQDYTARIAAEIRENKTKLFFKGLTGFDLFTSDAIQSAIRETRADDWGDVVVILTSPKSEAFSSEVDAFYTPERLSRMQHIVTDFLKERLFAPIPPNCKFTRGIFYNDESLAMVNLLFLDEDAYIFFRGFTKIDGPAGQVIVHLQLAKCSQLIRDILDHVERFYVSRCQPQVAG